MSEPADRAGACKWTTRTRGEVRLGYPVSCSETDLASQRAH
jgi:hypothetical protein